MVSTKHSLRQTNELYISKLLTFFLDFYDLFWYIIFIAICVRDEKCEDGHICKDCKVICNGEMQRIFMYDFLLLFKFQC